MSPTSGTSRQAYQALKSLTTHKTDRNDARGLAHLARTGFFKSVHVKSLPAHAVRSLIIARKKLVGQRVTLENQIRGLAVVFGAPRLQGRPPGRSAWSATDPGRPQLIRSLRQSGDMEPVLALCFAACPLRTEGIVPHHLDGAPTCQASASAIWYRASVKTGDGTGPPAPEPGQHVVK
ncbi:hypothetical protein B2G69_10895 [Methylorubrum zatmanii]|nr:hypothetical protein B2G69_10895 [Methylorubrum zatmanii]